MESSGIERAPPWRGELYECARLGLVPAEVLSQQQRWTLVAELHRAGWGDRRIAELTRMSEYTTARIRAEMGLRPNVGGGEG